MIRLRAAAIALGIIAVYGALIWLISWSVFSPLACSIWMLIGGLLP